MAITLRSGKELQIRKETERKQTDEEEVVQNQNQTSTENGQEIVDITYESQQQNEGAIQKKKEEVRVYQPLIPFPKRLKQTKLDYQFAKFLNVFRKLEISIPFAEALAQMPHYCKFMK